MREIRFRGKRTDNGEWVYGWYIKAKGHWHNKGIHEDWIICHAMQNGGWFALGTKYPVIPETVGQFTGLHDKNGKEIYEGDVFPHPGGIKYGRYRVTWDDDCAGFGWFNGDGTGFSAEEIEVIGNIHDKVGDE